MVVPYHSYHFKTYSISDIVIDKVEFSNIEDLRNLAKILVAITIDKDFPMVSCLIKLTLMTAFVKRLFSSIKRIKTNMGNIMRDNWVNDILVVLSQRKFL